MFRTAHTAYTVCAVFSSRDCDELRKALAQAFLTFFHQASLTIAVTENLRSSRSAGVQVDDQKVIFLLAFRRERLTRIDSTAIEFLKAMLSGLNAMLD